MGLADPIGCIIGIAIGPLIIFDDDVNDHDLGRQHTENLLLIQAIACTLTFLPTGLFFKEKPKYFPSNAARTQSKL